MASESIEQNRLSGRLDRNRRRLFIGRNAEKAALEAFATAPIDEPGLVGHLCAPGGAGKTTLLKAFVQDTACRFPVLWLDARDIPPDPSLLADTIQALRAQHQVIPGQPHLLIIDTFEYLVPLENWLREVFMPTQEPGFRMIIAGRSEPALEWRTDPAWVDEHRYWRLTTFSAAETHEYLALRGIDVSQTDRAHQFARGNPLALALFADSMHRGDNTSQVLSQSWRERLVGSLDNHDQQAALEACCVVRQLDEAMLARMLDRENADALFQWLQSQSYIETGPGGLYPHDLLRQAFTDDLKTRQPDRLVQLGDRAFSALHDRLESDVSNRLQLIQDAFFLLRNADIQQHSVEPDEPAVYVDHVCPADWPFIDDMMRHYEQDDAIELLHRLHDAQPESLKIVRDPSGKTLGFFQILRVEQLPRSILDADPVCARFLKLAQDTLGHQGTVILNRFWLHRDHDMEATAVYRQAFSHLAFLVASATPALLGSRQGDTPAWRRVSARFGHHQAPIDDAARRGMPAMFIYQDLTANSKAGINWLRQAYRFAFGLSDPGVTAATPQRSLPDQPTFQRALRQAFRFATRLDKLQANALLDCQLLLQNGAEENYLARARALQRLMKETCNRLETLATTESHARVLQATYLRPAPNQQAAAERLALSYATYRRRLTEALRLVESEWWAEELKLRKQ